MCNINILLKAVKDGEGIYATSFLSAVTTLSFNNNKDGEGVYLNVGDTFKSEDKLDYWGIRKKIDESSVIMTHQRIATSGFSVDYLHPFEDDGFVLVHNGVMSTLAEGTHSDTYCMFKKFKTSFNRKRGEREQKIVKAIKTLFEDNYGTWSVAIYDKITGFLYYFKDSMTDINFVRSEDKTIAYLSTSKENMDLLPMLQKDMDEIELKDYNIYKFWNKKKKIKFATISAINKIKKTYEPINTSCKHNNYDNWKKVHNYDSNRDFQQELDNNTFTWLEKLRNKQKKKETRDMQDIIDGNEIKLTLKEKKDYLGFSTDNKEDDCFYCGKPTPNYLFGTGKMICDDCLEEEDTYEQIKNEIGLLDFDEISSQF